MRVVALLAARVLAGRPALAKQGVDGRAQARPAATALVMLARLAAATVPLGQVRGTTDRERLVAAVSRRLPRGPMDRGGPTVVTAAAAGTRGDRREPVKRMGAPLVLAVTVRAALAQIAVRTALAASARGPASAETRVPTLVWSVPVDPVPTAVPRAALAGR